MRREDLAAHVRTELIPELFRIFELKGGPYQWGDSVWSNLERIGQFAGLGIPTVAVVLVAKHLGCLASEKCSAQDCDGALSRIVDCIVYLMILHGYFAKTATWHTDDTDRPEDS